MENETGEEVLITKAGHPLVKIIPAVERADERQLGVYKGKIKFHHDLLDPLPDEVVADFWPNRES